ncbi:AAA family ATPase [Georgenia alba]|uniref:AAA family ATPase n=1 Tax=Georgenia alba TaxID=2233858 RepID=A0ABW2Q3E4_9MICO
MATTPGRRRILERLARGLARRAADRQVLRVAVDGPDAAGKTTFARDLDGLLYPLLPAGAELRRFSTDDLLAPVVLRGELRHQDPHWVYEHAYPLDLIREIAVGNPAHDHPGTVVIAEGMSLLRPELADLWDVTVYLTVSEEVTLERVRDRLDEDDDIEGVLGRYRNLYLPALALYRAIADPMDRSDVVIDMTDVEAPAVQHWNGL